MNIEEHEITSEDVSESLRTLADQIDDASGVDASVVCIIRVDDSMRLYAIGDDLSRMIAQASNYLDAAVQSLAVANRSTH